MARKGEASGTPRKGERVRWNTSQGETVGRVEKKLTRRTKVGGHGVAASKDDPQLLVRSEKTGKRAAHRPGALRRAGKERKS